MHHARNAEVLDVLIAARALGRDIGAGRRLSHFRISRRRNEGGLGIHLQRQSASTDQTADSHAAATRQRSHLARDNCQVRGLTLQSRRREPEKCLSGRRRRLTHGGASAREAGAPASAAGVGASGRVSVDDRDAGDVDAKLFGGHLRNRDAHAGSDVYFARIDRDRAVGVDREETVDLSRIERSSVAGELACGRLLAERRQPAERKADDEAARRLQPVTPIHVESA